VRLQSVLDQSTGPWGIKVTLVEVKQVDLPDQMIRAIARQAEDFGESIGELLETMLRAAVKLPQAVLDQ
jgi:regulator of protease activity HflC (stomatin/prohibitin superfamily)